MVGALAVGVARTAQTTGVDDSIERVVEVEGIPAALTADGTVPGSRRCCTEGTRHRGRR